MKVSPLVHVRRNLLRGTVLVLPLLITVWLLGLLFATINRTIAPWIVQLLDWAGLPSLEQGPFRTLIPLVALVLTAAVIYLLGLLVGNILGRRVVALIEAAILRIPLVNGIYGSARQLLNAFDVGGQGQFSRVVAVEYPRRGTWTVGFVTREADHRMADGRRYVPVFLPTAPNPTSGWMVLFATDELTELDLSIEDAVKLVVSAGLVGPDDLGRLSRPSTLGDGSG